VNAATRTGDRPLLEVDDLEVRLKNVRAVDGLSMHIAKGETLGLVGESGSGKSTTDRAALQLVPTAAGSIRLDGTDLATADAAARRNLRRRAQMMFQDQFGSLNQRMRVGDIIVAEPLEIHRIGDQAARRRRVDQLLSVVGLPANAARRFPHGAARGDPRPRRSARRFRTRCPMRGSEAPRLEPSGGFRARPDAAAFWSRDQPRLPACLQAARRPWRCCKGTCCCSTQTSIWRA
jgi:ABC-type glutathione transport system ATPase component